MDTTGAGDVFHAALAVALGEGRAEADAVAFAAMAAALKCLGGPGVLGAPTRAAVERRCDSPNPRKPTARHAGVHDHGMKIIILGAGRVGESVAESLVSEHNDITVIDTDPARLRALQDRLDLRGVVGNGIQPSVLRDAGIEDADMLIACAPLDETNLVVCKIAHDLFNVPTRIARIRSPEFETGTPLLDKGGFSVDEVICPEQSVTAYMHKLMEYPEALQVLEFADGLVSLIAVRAVAGGPLVRHSLAEIPSLVPAGRHAHRGDLPPGQGDHRTGGRHAASSRRRGVRAGRDSRDPHRAQRAAQDGPAGASG